VFQSGSIQNCEYISINRVGFGTIRNKRSTTLSHLDPTKNYPTDEIIFIRNIRFCAIKVPIPADGPCVFPQEKLQSIMVKILIFDGKMVLTLLKILYL
jgi:hypothetical protein